MFYIENQNSRTYLVYQLSENDAIDNLTLGMMNNNAINGFLKVSYSHIDDKKYLKYDITSKISANQIFSAPVNKTWVMGIFKSISKAMVSSEEYMINKDAFIMDLNYIFVDLSKHEAFLVCLPLLNREEVDFNAFFKRIMFSAKFDQAENCNYVANIINYLNSSVSFNAKAFLSVLNEDTGNANTSAQSASTATVPVKPEVRTAPVQSNQITTAPANVQQSVVQNVQQSTIPNKSVQQQNSTVVKQQYQNVQNNQKANNKPDKKSAKSKKQPTAMPDNMGFAVPGSVAMPVDDKSTNKQVQNTAGKKDDSEKKMSMFYLMCHYNKENAATYKAQKEAKSVQANKEKTNASKNTPENQNAQNNYQIPNQQHVQPVRQNVNQTTQQTNIPPTNQNQLVQPVQNQQANNYVQNNAGANYQAQNYQPQNYQTQNYSAQPDSTDFGATTVLGGGTDGETTVLSDFGPDAQAVSVKQPFIIRMSNNEKISINKPVFRIGKERSYVDYFIGDNSYISRGHANIISHDGRYFIVDNNSRNHTFVNGEIITSSTEVELKSGDTIKLANEAFEFKLF